MARTYITSRGTYADAWELADEYAAQLRAMGLVPRHRVKVEPRGAGWWLVLITDEDTEDETESEE